MYPTHHLVRNKIMKTEYFRSPGTLIGRFILLLILPLLSSLTFTLKVSAQTIGFNAVGSTTYPTAIVGTNADPNTGLNVANNYLVADQYTTSVPLTAIQIMTKGNGGGNVKVSIYSNSAGNVPGTRQCPEIQITGVSTSGWTTFDISDIYLPVGTYWIVFNCSVAKGVGQTNITGPPRRFFAQTYATAFQSDMSALGWSAPAGNADATYIVGVPIQGYAKATKAVLPVNGIFSSMSFYSHATGNARLAIYNDVSGVPSAKQWESGDITVTASAWTTVSITSGTPTNLYLNGGTYWLAWQWNSAANGPSYTSGAANTGNAIVQSYGSFPSSWTGGTLSTENWSIYATYTACTPPTIYNVTGGGGYCSGGSGAAVGLSNSETGVTYQLNIGGTTQVGSLVSGTGSAISFGNQTTAGTYTVVATRTTGGCINNMSGTATVTVNPIPTASATKNDITCFNAHNGQIVVTGANGTSPYTYSIYNGVAHSPYPDYQSSNTFNGLAPGQYQIRVKDNKTCESIQIPLP